MGGLIDLMGFNAEYILYNILLKTNNLDTVSSENGLLTPSKPLYIDGTYKVGKHWIWCRKQTSPDTGKLWTSSGVNQNSGTLPQEPQNIWQNSWQVHVHLPIDGFIRTRGQQPYLCHSLGFCWSPRAGCRTVLWYLEAQMAITSTKAGNQDNVDLIWMVSFGHG